MRLRPAIVLLALLAVLACTPDDPRPNLLLITIDTLRADSLACYDGPPKSGVGLCALFESGTRFRWAFTSAPYTTPAIASLLTSQYPAHHGVTQSARSYLDDSATSVAEKLGEAGYTTAAFVSNPVLDPGRNLGQGFGVYDAAMTRRERNRPGYAEREAAATTDAALAWAELALREPWFLWVHYQDPHGPYEPPQARPRRDPPTSPRLPVLKIQSGREGIPAYQALPGLFTLPAYRKRYLDEIQYLDPHLERLVMRLEALGGPPAILLTADHGEAFGEDGYYFAHGHSLGLDQIRVPLLYRGRAPEAPRVVEEAVSLIDVAPTLLSLAGVAIPESFQGRALPVAGLGGAREPRALFAEHGRRAAVIADGSFYSRDRERLSDGRRELGQELPELPTRSARLPGADALPAYRVPPGPEAERLEAELAGFLRETRHLEGVRHEQVTEEMLERMRALGYVED